MGLLNLFKPSRNVVVVDMISLFDSLGMKGDIPPRAQLQMLARLTRFAEREQIEMIAVMSGTPLSKAPAGKKFDSILVLYSASMEAHVRYVAKVAASRKAILLTDNNAIEKLAGGGVPKMRISTFCKAFNSSSSSDGQESSDGGRNRRSRRGRGRSKGKTQNECNDGEDNSSDAIKELIDLVD